MSQHDYNISTADANTGPSFRAAVNSALQALVGNNWGNAEPVTPYAHMLWVDTSGAIPLLKIRNSANDAWIYLFSLGADQLLLANDIVINGVTIGLGSGNSSTNTAVGLSALGANSFGTGNVAVGSYALSSNTTGGPCAAIGASAMESSTSSTSNTAVGPHALRSITTGSYNTAIGTDAGVTAVGGAANQTSSYSVYVGRNTKPSANGNTNEIVIGESAEGGGSNTATIGNASITKTVLSGVIQKRALDTAPASATATGTAGEIRVTATHIYVCTATNTWVRAALATW